MNNKQNKKDERRGGFYWKGDESYVSVTTVLKILDKPALRYWFGKEVYYAMVKDPTLSEGEALSAPYKTSGKAQERGKTIHSLVEAYKKTGAVIDTVPEPLKGYANAFYAWTTDNKITDIENEKTVFNEEYLYAGTLDMLARVNGVSYLIDCKTGKDIYPESALQISAYQAALPAPVEKIGVLLLKEDGKYKFEEAVPRFEIFLSVKKIWEWVNKDLIEKVGYKGVTK